METAVTDGNRNSCMHKCCNTTWKKLLWALLILMILVAIITNVTIALIKSSSSEPYIAGQDYCFSSFPTHNIIGGTISGTDIMEFTNTNVYLQSTTILTDNVKLILHGGCLMIHIEYFNSAKLLVQANASLILYDAFLLKDQAGLISNWEFTENAIIYFENVTRRGWMSIRDNVNYTAIDTNTGVTLLPPWSGSMTLKNNPALWLELYLEDGTHLIDNPPKINDVLNNDSPFMNVLNNLYEGGTFDIDNSIIEHLDIGINNFVHVTMSNIEELSFAWSLGLCSVNNYGYNEWFNISNLETRYIDDEIWNIANSSVQIKNTNLKYIWGSYWCNVNIRWKECSFVDMQLSNNVKMEFIDSTLDQLVLNDNAVVILNNVDLRRKDQKGAVAVNDNAKLTIINSPDIIDGETLSVADTATVIYL